MKKWLSCHECIRRTLRTFIQAAVGVLTAAVISAAGVVSRIDVEAVIATAVATGLAAVMNMSGGNTEEEEDDDGSNED